MSKKSILTNIAYPTVTAEIIADAIRDGIFSFDDALNTGEFDRTKQKAVKELLAFHEREDNAFRYSNTLPRLEAFLQEYPRSKYRGQVEQKIIELESEKKAQQRQRFESIKKNIHDYKPDELKNQLSEDMVRDICDELGVDYRLVLAYDEPYLRLNDIPQTAEDIPTGFTDVFFWGIPSSGKTSALATILRTMNDKYTISSPSLEKKFGAAYRDSLINIFDNQIGYLPASTQKDRTQYMPFLLKRREEKKYRQISFFELSGEVFNYLYELDNNSKILNEDDRDKVEKSFETLDLLLNSNNQKIHFFFIDYQRQTKKDRNNLTQENYLNAAATYFRDKKDIFKKKTDAVYVVVTKADQIPTDNNGETRTQLAGRFLSENFGNFMDAIKHRCQRILLILM